MVLYQDLLIKVLGAFLILILGLIIAQIVTNISRKFFKTISISKVLEEQLKLKIPLERYLSSTLKYIVYLITLILILNQLGIPSVTVQWILIIFLILITIFIILAFKDWLPNLISGLYLIRSEKVKPGDKIKVKGITGKVIKVSLLETQIETNNNELIFLPNANITKYEVIKQKNGKSIRTN